MRVIVSDGRIFVKRVAAQKPDYDLVLLDAFEADYIPEHMLTREFLEEVKSTMAPGGVIVRNAWMLLRNRAASSSIHDSIQRLFHRSHAKL